MKTNNKTVCGIGINDADYAVNPRINGKQAMCPFFQKWMSMLKRCYSEPSLRRQPTYNGCTVSAEWHSFMNFKRWMAKQNWRGRHLDKDIIQADNKVYKPSACMFVSPHINLLLNDNKANRGPYPRGVDFIKANKNYRAKLTMHGITQHVGVYETPEEAHAAYCLAKADYIESLFPELTDEDPRLLPALQRHADNFRKKSREQAAHSNQNQN